MKALTFTLLLIIVLVLASSWISEPVYGQSKLANFFAIIVLLLTYHKT